MIIIDTFSCLLEGYDILPDPNCFETKTANCARKWCSVVQDCIVDDGKRLQDILMDVIEITRSLFSVECIYIVGAFSVYSCASSLIVSHDCL